MHLNISYVHIYCNDILFILILYVYLRGNYFFHILKIVLLKMNSDFINEEKPVDQTEYGVNNVYIVNSRVDIFGQGQAVTNKVSFKFYVHVLTIQF